MNCVDATHIAPSAWGPAMWRFMHTFAYQLDEPTAMPHFSEIIQMLVRAMPCHMCRTHALDYIKRYRPPSSTREEAVLYVHRFHNAVNRRLHKPEYDLRRCALKHARSSLAYRAAVVVRRLRRALPVRCPSVDHRTSTTVVLAYGDATRRTHELASSIALIEALSRDAAGI